MRIVALKDFSAFARAHAQSKQAVLQHLLCLDIGTKHIGLAKCDLYHFQIQPCGMIERKPGLDRRERDEKLTKSLQAVINKENVVGVIAGFPLHLDGSITPLAQQILQLMTRLPCTTAGSNEPNSMVCTFWDERYTTSEARSHIRGMSDRVGVAKKFVDTFAAAMILKGFLQHNSIR